MNELPERDQRNELKTTEIPVIEPATLDAATMLKVGGFLAVVVVLTALAINNHDSSTQTTMAPETPPATEGASTLPSADAPTDRTTTGASPRGAPGIAPNAPSETPAAGTGR